MHAVHGCDVAGKLSSCCRRRVVRCSCTSANPCTMANAMEHFQPNPRTRGNASRRCDAKAKSRLSQDSCVLRDSATMRHARCVKTQRCCACSKDLSQNGYRKLPIGIAYCCCLLLLPIGIAYCYCLLCKRKCQLYQGIHHHHQWPKPPVNMIPVWCVACCVVVR